MLRRTASDVEWEAGWFPVVTPAGDLDEPDFVDLAIEESDWLFLHLQDETIDALNTGGNAS